MYSAPSPQFLTGVQSPSIFNALAATSPSIAYGNSTTPQSSMFNVPVQQSTPTPPPVNSNNGVEVVSDKNIKAEQTSTQSNGATANSAEKGLNFWKNHDLNVISGMVICHPFQFHSFLNSVTPKTNEIFNSDFLFFFLNLSFEYLFDPNNNSNWIQIA